MTKRSAVVASAVAAAVAGAGAAFAAWTLSGTGSASASAGSVQTLTVGSVSSTALVPNNKADVTIHVANPNKFPVQITGIEFSDISTTATGCDAGSVTFVAGAPLPAPTTLVLGADGTATDEKDILYPASLQMDNTATDECKNATFTFHVDLDALSAAA
ncbi:hypothetical protein [Actinoplanes siamensis]|nr:hypothetical protein [Actinoplanes siamensis]